jgi:hypothetical protein
MPDDNLNWRHFLDREWYTSQEVARLIEATGLDLAEDFSAERLRRHLNEIVKVSVARQLERTRSKKEWLKLEKLMASVLEYSELANDWGDHIFPLPRLTKFQIEQLEFAKTYLGSLPKEKIRRRVGAWEDMFFPRALGLFAAAYGLDPMPTLAEATEDNSAKDDFDNPAIDFLEEILLFIRDEQVRLGFEGCFERPGLPTLVWNRYESRTISNKISEFKRAKSDHSSEHVLWMAFRDLYELNI